MGAVCMQLFLCLSQWREQLEPSHCSWNNQEIPAVVKTIPNWFDIYHWPNRISKPINQISSHKQHGDTIIPHVEGSSSFPRNSCFFERKDSTLTWTAILFTLDLVNVIQPFSLTDVDSWQTNICVNTQGHNSMRLFLHRVVACIFEPSGGATGVGFSKPLDVAGGLLPLCGSGMQLQGGVVLGGTIRAWRERFSDENRGDHGD